MTYRQQREASAFLSQYTILYALADSVLRNSIIDTLTLFVQCGLFEELNGFAEKQPVAVRFFVSGENGELWVNRQASEAVTNPTPFRFTGKPRDTETKLTDFGARLLDSKTSRWMSADPAMGQYVPSPGMDVRNLPGLGGIYNAINFAAYGYAGNNPINLTDPDGEKLRVPNLSFGFKAHQDIIGYLMEHWRGRPQVYLPNPSAPSGTIKGGFFVDYARKIGNVTEFYEIKPISYMSSREGDKQLQNYVDRANYDAKNKNSNETFVKGTSLLSQLNGVTIDTLMFQGPDIIDLSKPGKITLTTDPVNHPGMIFYTLDDGWPEGEGNKVQEFIENLFPSGVPWGVPGPAPAPVPVPIYGF